MDHLNYFFPYNSKGAQHEDNLTRAFLATIRISLLAQAFFFDYLKEEIYKLSQGARFPTISTIKHKDVIYETQTASKNIDFQVSKLFSVLISDKKIHTNQLLGPSDRAARYDGVIYLNQDIAVIIENKPFHKNVWEGQLKPNIEKDFPYAKDGLFERCIELEWKEIIKRFTNILEIESINRADQTVITDFLDYVEELYPELNPYDHFRLCNNNPVLIKRRIRSIIEGLAEEDKIKRNNSWFIIDLPELREVGLTYEDSRLNIELCFADTVGQARIFYNRKIPFSRFNDIVAKGWKLFPNFHMSNHFGQGLIWLSTKHENIQKYYDYWQSDRENIKQIAKAGLDPLLKTLSSKDLLVIDAKTKNEVKAKVKDQGWKTLNIIPGFKIQFSYDKDELDEMDEKNDLIKDIKQKINQGVSLIKGKVSYKGPK